MESQFWYWAKILLMVGMFVIALSSVAIFVGVILQYRNEEFDEE